MQSSMMAMPDPRAAPKAVAIEKVAVATVHRENGVASATYLVPMFR